jgi:hypothetical protein
VKSQSNIETLSFWLAQLKKYFLLFVKNNSPGVRPDLPTPNFSLIFGYFAIVKSINLERSSLPVFASAK